jgi:hypothetical protein
MAARRRKAGSVKVCRIVRGKVKCSSAKRPARRGRRLGSVVLGGMPRRNAKGRFVKSR